MKILAVGDPHGEVNKIKNISLREIDLVLITGDIGKADFARKRFFEDIKRQKEGLPKLELTKTDVKRIYSEIYDSTMGILKYISKTVPTYSILGNVGADMIKGSEVKKDETKFKVKLPYLREGVSNLNNFYLVKNAVRNISGLRIGFLEYFIDTSWVKEFKPSDYNKKLKKAKKETVKAKRILNNFKSLDILVCHQPPYGYLDKVSPKYNPPKDWIGKHAGSKVILDYIKKYQPKYVFCGHIHEGEGKAKIGKTEVYNLGVAGHKIINL
ncbi:MAG TPA: metallophosphoesterase [Candidatus Pacearchaeota archaeon]|jgi:Icc-related predicted phosphoesterase|nr:metallophosphoesterase [Candidatus Pacearchaeota archaeon]HPX74512.1 metallophosphoesterase [Candidatus Pacearchaeota archaeon]HQC61022.1 metallophosphoesterase [Candidatus Pacearchaeota archaeon]